MGDKNENNLGEDQRNDLDGGTDGGRDRDNPINSGGIQSSGQLNSADDSGASKVSDGSPGNSDGSLGNSDGSVRDLLSVRPFVKGARAWRDKGWIGTIPLPPRAKFPPPTGWTGRNAGFADNAQVSEWARMAQYRRGNIGLHLGFPVKNVPGQPKDKEFQIVGIDVDDYFDGDKLKTGASQLKELESQYGELPQTYVSTARAEHGDFYSGIRFFLVPSGLAFTGQADKDIEIIQKKHRFAVVWPSYNPKSNSQYLLYSPDEWAKAHNGNERPPTAAEKRSRKRNKNLQISLEPTRDIPFVNELPLLPQAWVDYLTEGGMRDDNTDIDMESSVDEIDAWAEHQFNSDTKMCARMRKEVDKWRRRIVDEATAHDKVRDAHWEIYNLAAEGHVGWKQGISNVEKRWINDVVDRNKRTNEEIRKEIFRSRINALRKIKAKVDAAESAGSRYTLEKCECLQREEAAGFTGGASESLGGNAGGLFESKFDSTRPGKSGKPSEFDPDSIEFTEDESPPDGLEHVSMTTGKSPDEYDMNDDGNAEFLLDILRYGQDRVKFIEGYGWILWTDTSPGHPGRWLKDVDGLIERAFWRVKRLQVAFAEQKVTEAKQIQKDFRRQQAVTGGAGFPPGTQGALTAEDVKSATALANKWVKWAERSGNKLPIDHAIRSAKKFPRVSIDINELDRNPYLLGVENGVIELRTDGPYLRNAAPDDFITHNTNAPWEGIYAGIPEHDYGKRLWEEYLDNFVPERYRNDFQTILGHCLIGGNPERLLVFLLGGTSTGKSTMLRAVGAALGDYAGPVSMTVFQNHKLNPALAEAMPKRVVFASELSENDRMAVATVKRMTGDDVVTAELKGSNVQVRGIPQFIPIIATNTPPEITGADEALRRRLLVLPFDQRIEGKRDEKRAAEHLESHSKEAILAWLVEGYSKYCEVGLPNNIEFTELTDEFATELDDVSNFVAARLIRSPGDRVNNSDMFTAYQFWCEDEGQHISSRLTHTGLSRRLKGLGFTMIVGKKSADDGGRVSVRVWENVKIARKSSNTGSNGPRKSAIKLRTIGSLDEER